MRALFLNYEKGEPALDEPVLILRATDTAAFKIMKMLAERCQENGAPADVVRAVRLHAEEARKWRARNKTANAIGVVIKDCNGLASVKIAPEQPPVVIVDEVEQG